MNYELIIVGGGPAGLTAGIYATRDKIKTLLIEKVAPGGQVILSENIENYPGFPEGISGLELVRKMEEQAKKFGLEIISGEVKKLKINPVLNTGEKFPPKADQPWAEKIVETENEKYESLAVIIATGAEAKKLNVPGEEKLIGKGVSYCAICDGPFFKNQEVAVIGGGDAAVQEAIFLTRFAKKVFLIHRRTQLRATKILQERVKSNPKIEFLWDTVVNEIYGDKRVEALRTKNVKSGEERKLPIQGIFVLIGIEPQTKFLQGVTALDKNGYVLTDENMQTSVPGIYACGDCRKKLLRQVVTACAEGAMATFAASRYIEELGKK